MPSARMGEAWPGTADDMFEAVYHQRYHAVGKQTIHRRPDPGLSLEHIPGSQEQHANGDQGPPVAQLFAKIAQRLERRQIVRA